MELRQLRYFLAVAEELHFGRAAIRLHIAQPSLTQQIQNLESELGVQLFARSKRQVELTEAGQLFLSEVRLVLADVERSIRVAQRAGRGESGRLILAYAGATLYNVMPPILERFYAQYPDVDLTVSEVSTENQLPLLDQNAIHVGILHPPIRRSNIAYEVIFREPMILAIPENHPLAVCTKIAPEQLVDEPFILFPQNQGPWLYDQIISMCQQVGFSPHVVQEICPPNAVLGLVAANIGIAFVAASLQTVPRPGVVYRPISAQPIELETAVAWQKTSVSQVLQTFLNVVRKVAQQQKWCKK
jgi:DNA-binding transcriptional LysR family regulator